MTHRVFIDGQAGTTGLELATRLDRHGRIELIRIDECERKSPERRRELFAEADVVVLCLPDTAAREAVELVPEARFLDASTAHRVAQDWVYGLPELAPEQRESIRTADRVANPGCYPTGVVLGVRPLVDAGLLDPGTALHVHAVSGYSGGGKTLIAKYADNDSPAWRHRSYSLDLDHKHLPEMRAYAGMVRPPLFVPSVGAYHSGMLVNVGLTTRELEGGATPVDVYRVLADRYAGEPFVHVHGYHPESVLEDGFLSPTARNGTNHLDLMVFGNDDQILLASRFDNLGKGAAGAAVQNLNLMLGLPETFGLCNEVNA